MDVDASAEGAAQDEAPAAAGDSLELLSDPNFLRNVLGSLPGVDPSNPDIQVHFLSS
jgi:hypothetical protein